MKSYLFGLGAMLVGAGLMFVLMHGEVSAEGKLKKLEPFVCSKEVSGFLRNCQTKNLDCAVSIKDGNHKEIVCVKR